ncbi:MAG: response regulator transcription factor [Anaerolineae bacterium]|nr:response regulator transcription factor [Anaerolineae bacterium]
MPEATVLLVEGKNSNPQSLKDALLKAKYGTEVCHNGKTAMDSIAIKTPDLVVFNAASMRSNGSRTCRRLRKALGEVPIIYICQEGEPEEEAEADIYLEHPFTPRKLLNRIRTLLPADEDKDEVVRYGVIKFYPGKPSVDVAGRGEKRLTPKLAQLLQEFLRHPNEVVTRVQLMQNVWKTDYIGDTRTLDVHMRWVREVVELDPANPEFLLTVRGEGYVFVVPLEGKPQK